MVEGGSIIPLIELDQYLAGADALVIRHQHLLDEGVDMRRERSDVPADIGVVGAFDEATDRPPVASAPGCTDHRHKHRQPAEPSPQIESPWIRYRRTLEPDAVHGRPSSLRWRNGSMGFNRNAIVGAREVA